MNKKYNFDDILKEYNVEYKCNYSLSLNVYSVTIVHTTGNKTFNVTYSRRGEGIKKTKSLLDFIHYYVNNSSNLKYGNILNIILSKEKLDLKIEIWPPSKIRYAYLQSNYAMASVGNLGNSCMRKKEMQKALNFYVKNKVRIVVIIDNKNKIHARALLWDDIKSTKLKKPFTYLDRVYARSDMLLLPFYDLAKESNWKQYPSTNVNKMDKSYYKEGINTKGLCHIAYNDTFRCLYYKDNLLTSSSGLIKTKHSVDYVVLDVHNNEAYYPTLDPNRIREVISGNYISKKDATFIKKYGGWVLKKNIADINGDYYSVFDGKVVKTINDGYILEENSVAEIITNNMIDKNKATQSTKYKGFIHKSNVVYIKDELYHKLDTGIICFNNKWYRISQCFVNYDRSGLNKDLATQTGYVHYPQDYVPYWRRTKINDKNSKYAGLSRIGNPIPKECAVIAYDLVYNPIVDDIEYQEVYITDRKNIIQLITGELIANLPKNKQHLKKFNNKWYIKREFEPPNKDQQVFPFMNK